MNGLVETKHYDFTRLQGDDVLRLERVLAGRGARPAQIAQGAVQRGLAGDYCLWLHGFTGGICHGYKRRIIDALAILP